MLAKTWIKFSAIALTGLLLQGCVSMVVGVGAATGVAAFQERGIEGAARDLRTSSLILEAFFKKDHTLIQNIGVEVYDGRVLLTGLVKTEDIRATAVRLSWTIDGVSDVLNELQVTQDGSLLNTARDAWVSAQLEAKLALDSEVMAINYVIETVSATVYLIGFAQNAEELERVKNHARSISYVRHIISHVRIKVPASDAPPA